jgi:GGDEF domain-containing protein
VFEQVRHLAASDPLTGLANYRRLLDVLDTETERTLRTGRPFAVLLLDLDGLKKINDTYGHLVGSRALCRVADILRFTAEPSIRLRGTAATNLPWCCRRRVRTKRSACSPASMRPSPPT